MSANAIPENTYSATADIFDRVKNGYLIPASLAAMLDAQGILNCGSLSHEDQEIIKLLVNKQVDYRTSGNAMGLKGTVTALLAKVRRAIRAGRSPDDARRDALVRFVHHLQTTSGTIDEGEFNAIRTAGYSDAQLAEISLTIALGIFAHVFADTIGDCTSAE